MAGVKQPRIVRELLALDCADADGVSAFLYRLSNPQYQIWIDVPEASSFGVLRPEYRYFLDWEARAPGFLASGRLEELFRMIDGDIGIAVAKALQRSSSPVSFLLAATSNDPAAVAALAATDAISHPARRLECRLVRMAQIELGAIWRRIDERDWPSDLSAASVALFSDGDVLYQRARPYVWFSTSYSTRDQQAELEERVDAPGGLAQCYWLTLAIYHDVYPQVVPNPGRFCFYCKRSMPTERTWRDDIRTCGDKECSRRYEADRRWYRAHEDEVRPVVVKRLNLRDAANLHPGRARAVWVELGNPRDGRRMRAGA